MGCCSAPQSFSPSTYCLSTLTLVIVMLETHRFTVLTVLEVLVLYSTWDSEAILSP